MSFDGVIVLKRNTLEIWTKSGALLKNVSIPEEYISYLEVNNEEKFKKDLEKFFKNVAISKVFVVLEEDIIFTKTIAAEGKIEKSDELQKFIETVPLPPEFVGTVMASEAKNLIFFATNKKIYEAVVWALAENKIKARGVIPATILKGSHGGAELVKTLKSTKFPDKYNFLSGMVKKSSTSRNSKFQAGIIISLFALLLSAGGLIAAINRMKTTPTTKVVAKAEPTAEPVEISPTITIEPTKEPELNISVQILNTTKINGLAARVKEKLAGAGIETVETGNGSGQFNATVVQTNPGFNQETAELIAHAVGEIMSKVEVATAEAKSNFDVVIQLGGETK